MDWDLLLLLDEWLNLNTYYSPFRFSPHADGKITINETVPSKA